MLLILIKIIYINIKYVIIIYNIKDELIKEVTLFKVNII
jgi:hypothetical protein